MKKYDKLVKILDNIAKAIMGFITGISLIFLLYLILALLGVF